LDESEVTPDNLMHVNIHMLQSSILDTMRFESHLLGRKKESMVPCQLGD